MSFTADPTVQMIKNLQAMNTSPFCRANELLAAKASEFPEPTLRQRKS